MTITLGSVSYGFSVGDRGAQTPTSVNYARATHGTFVNTGLQALGHDDLLFDADRGYLGLRAEVAQGIAVQTELHTADYVNGRGRNLTLFLRARRDRDPNPGDLQALSIRLRRPYQSLLQTHNY